MTKRFPAISAASMLAGLVIFWVSFIPNDIYENRLAGDFCELAGTALILFGACYIVRTVAAKRSTQGLFFFGAGMEIWARTVDFTEEFFPESAAPIIGRQWEYSNYIVRIPESIALSAILTAMVLMAYELHRLRVRAVEDQHRARTLYKASLFLARVADMASQAVFGCDSKGAILTWNKGAQRLFGYEPGEAIGKNIDDLFAHRPWQHETTIAGYITHHGELKNVSTALKTKTRARLLGEASFSLVHDDRGRAAGISVVVQEVEERNRALHDLIASRNLLSRALQEVDVGLFVVSRDFTLLEYNARMSAITGLSQDEVRNSTTESLQQTLLRDAVPLLHELRDTVLGGGEHVECHNLQIYRVDGEACVCNVAISPVFGEDGEVVAAAGVVVDITERERLQAKLLEAQKMESIGRLARGIAHDFNNLLAAIMGHAGVARMDVDPESEMSRQLKSIEDAAQRAAALTHQLLAFARGNEPVRRSVNLNRIVDDNMNLLSSSIGQSINLVFERNTELDDIYAEPVQVQQVLMNLCINARDAVTEKGGNGAIRVSTFNAEVDEPQRRTLGVARSGAYACLRVEDNGCGMPPDVIGKVFEPFFSTKNRDQAYGLGMSVVYGIVQSHEGGIHVESKPGRGTRITVYMPSSGTHDFDARETAVEPGDVSGGSETILVVDDEDLVRAFLREVLEEKGYTVIEAATGEEALRIYRARGAEIGLVVLDVIMPGMGGVAALAELERIDPAVRCLVSSGFGPEHFDENLLHDDRVRYLPKPFKIGLLASNIRTLLDR